MVATRTKAQVVTEVASSSLGTPESFLSASMASAAASASAAALASAAA